MAEDIQSQLNAAIAAAKQGDRGNALRMLQDIVRQDPDNETAWMWLASTAASTTDKRRALQRVLQINPNNETAYAALQRLGGAPTDATTQQSIDVRNLVSIGILLAGILSVAAIIYVAVQAFRDATDTTVDTTEVVAFNTQIAQTQTPPTNAPTPTPSISPTFAGRLVSPQAVVTLPPTFTPTPAPTDLPTETPSPTPPPLANYTLYFTSIGAGEATATLYTSDASGDSTRALDVLGEAVAVSPDGSQIAFLATPASVSAASADGTPAAVPGAVDNVVEVFIAPADNLEAAQQLTTFGAESLSAPVWSPDGASLLVVREQTELENIPVDDPADVQTYVGGRDTGIKTDPAWSPDGTTIVYASDQETPGLLELYAYTIDTDSIERLTDYAGSSFAPAYSPDGTQIAFISDRNGDTDLFIMDADGSSPLLLTFDDNDAEDQAPAWSADGRWIAFSSNRGGGTFQIYLVNSQGTDITQVTDNERNNQSPSFRP